MVSCSGPGPQHVLWEQHGPWTSTGLHHGHQYSLWWPHRSHSMVSSSSMDHGGLSTRFNPENESFFTLDILLFLRVRVILWLGSEFRDRTCASSRLVHTICWLYVAHWAIFPIISRLVHTVSWPYSAHSTIFPFSLLNVHLLKWHRKLLCVTQCISPSSPKQFCMQIFIATSLVQSYW